MLLPQEQETQAQLGVLDRTARSKELIEFARSGDSIGVEGLLNRGLDANYTQQVRVDYGYALYTSSGGGGAMGHVTHEETPLIVASRKGHLGVVQLLVSRGADVNKRLRIRRSEETIIPGDCPDIDEGNALSIAIREKQDNVALYLISISNEDSIKALFPEKLMTLGGSHIFSRKTLLHLAVESQCSLDVIRALRSKNCSTTIAAEYRRSDADYMARFMCLLFCSLPCASIPLFIAIGSSRGNNFLTVKEQTPIELATSMGRHDIVDALQGIGQGVGPTQQMMTLDSQNQQPTQSLQGGQLAPREEGTGHLIARCSPVHAAPQQPTLPTSTPHTEPEPPPPPPPPTP